jgi:hypothetical protein
MGLMAWLNLEGKDVAGFLGACLLGYFAGTFMPEGAWAVYTSILVAYHLFLFWLVITAEHETGVSLPIASTILTHLACMVIILPLGMGRHFVPFFGILQYGIASLAIFERGWLFSGKSSSSTPKPQETPTSQPIVTSSADDYQEWLRYLAQQKPGSRKLGTSLKAEYEQWLLTRASARPAEPSSNLPHDGR